MLEFNPYSYDLHEDPYPTYKRFLEDGPIHYVDYGGGVWAVFHHADCAAVFRNQQLTAKRGFGLLLGLPPERHGEFSELVRLIGLWMLFIDAPEHSRLRKLMNKGFAPAVIDAFRPRVEGIVDRMLESLRNTSETDIMREIAHPLPVRVVADLLGVPGALHEQCIRWSDAIATLMMSPHRTIQEAQTAQEAVLSLTEFFREAVKERRHKKSDDLISLLISIEEDGEVLTEEELYAQCVMLLFAGHETTRNLVGNGMVTLPRRGFVGSMGTVLPSGLTSGKFCTVLTKT